MNISHIGGARAALAAPEVDRAIAAMPAWSFDAERGYLTSRFILADFNEAFGFMTRVALLAANGERHLEWSNLYNVVSIGLTTPEAGGVTARDIQFAREIEEAHG